ncbi:MAG: TIGR00159 family protein [Deltaproteobacteria bacterium]|nr:TIGR00159 family protein [Deltaproteobacteria bacterium]
MGPELLQGFFRDTTPQGLLLAAIDIAIVYYIIYRALVLVRGTRAVQTGLKLGLVFIVYYVARVVGLVTVYTMLNVLWGSLILILVVIFQNDIRRALTRMGTQRRWFLGLESRESTETVDQVVEATRSLAQKRIGALIVFERDASLDEFIEEGTKIDATVSSALLYSLFIPSYENPVHDGAAIVRKHRIAQAGAFLPLTANPKLEKTLGTRHRAAIGITEETDAVVVVVSEERGTISLCFNGNIARNLDAASLRKALLGLFHKRRPTAPARARQSQAPPASKASKVGVDITAKGG